MHTIRFEEPKRLVEEYSETNVGKQMNKVITETFETTKKEISQAGSFIPIVRVLEILENLRAVIETVDISEGNRNADYTKSNNL